jgi:hypothetical protein
MTKKNKETILEVIALDRLIDRARRAQQTAVAARAQPRRLSPGVAAVEASLAAYVLGAVQRGAGEGENAATLVVTALLQAFGILGADSSLLAPHAEAVATGLLSVSAYRAALAAKRRPPK